jgi:hypothetical protein
LEFAFDAFIAEFLVVGDFAMAALEDLAEVGVGAGFLGSEQASDAEEGDLAEKRVDFLGGGEGAGGFGEFGDGLLVRVGFVGEAEVRAGGADGLGALASGRGAVLTAGECGFWFGLWIE